MSFEEKPHPNISAHLLWEYDPNGFDFIRAAQVVIDRVIERGNLEDWRAILAFYGREKILEAARKSRQLSKKDKQFTEIFIFSQLLHAA